MNENLPDVSEYEKQLDAVYKDLKKGVITEEECSAKVNELAPCIAAGHDYRFVGKVGQFCPMKPGSNAGLLVRESIAKTGEKKYDAATGTKGYRWMESETVSQLNMSDSIDRGYYDAMVDTAVHDISEFGDFEWFVSEDPYVNDGDGLPPWMSAGEPWDRESEGAMFAVR